MTMTVEEILRGLAELDTEIDCFKKADTKKSLVANELRVKEKKTMFLTI